MGTVRGRVKVFPPCFITPITADEAKDIDYIFRRTKNKIKARSLLI